MTIFIYAVLIFLVIRFSVTVFNFLSNPKLSRVIKHYQDKVSILIPARNEAENIIDLLTSIQEQDYIHYEVIVLDDGSSDNTFALVEAFCTLNPNFRVVKGKELPADWLGKNFACHQLAEMATGKYLLFIDADETIKRGLINSLIARMEIGNLALLSVFTNQIMLSIGERLTVPLMHFILLNLLPLRLVKLSKNPAFAAASGQCMFFNAHNYNENQWHERVKNQVVEDVEIMKRVKLEKFNAEALLANSLIYCRMYKGLNESIVGFSKNLLAGFGNNILILLLYQLLVTIGPVILILNFNITLLVLPLTLIILSRIMISYLSGQNVLINLILHPFQMLFFLIISLISIKKHIFKTGTWKGRTIKAI
ncbi:glycosyltransferase family 2 protein [Pedobacter sp. HDW13]|uniref:glycosyltransferase family 2 protein n=1 Tax=unclassified Pedobacter TaxID=2628915 RepID=UPI000F598CF9|nr:MULTISPECIES: glycosyltransferase family 2 protein [unclassified Pedobacter]QIL40171.1 glycosyltransferase family 2 protein [Pedobacter sp. HDW13]RQO70964.1 glycosyl transferase family 2 [Pedobacter sp. KBW01]